LRTLDDQRVHCRHIHVKGIGRYLVTSREGRPLLCLSLSLLLISGRCEQLVVVPSLLAGWYWPTAPAVNASVRKLRGVSDPAGGDGSTKPRSERKYQACATSSLPLGRFLSVDVKIKSSEEWMEVGVVLLDFQSTVCAIGTSDFIQ
jgi:hypothetical protein